MKQLRSGLIVPVNITRRYEFFCRMCDAEFFDEPALLRHAESCYEDHAEELHNKNTRHNPFFESADPELSGWVKEHRTEILEGRKRFGSSQ